MAFTLCTSQQAKLAAGLNANSTITASVTDLNYWSEEAEDYICTAMRYDVITNYGSLTTNGKKILGQWAAKLIGQDIIAYDASGYTSRFEAELMMDNLENKAAKIEAKCTDDKHKKYLGIQ